MPKYEWIGGIPRYWKIVFYLMAAEFSVGFIFGITAPLWARQIQDASHSFALRMKGQGTFYLSPRLGWFMSNYLWIFLDFLVSWLSSRLPINPSFGGSVEGDRI